MPLPKRDRPYQRFAPLIRWGAMAWRTLVGGALAQFPLTALFVLGWTMVLMRQAAVQRWWKRSATRQREGIFSDWAASESWASAYAKQPTWLLLRAEDTQTRLPRILYRLRLARLMGGLWRNGRLGLQGIANIAVITVLPAVLWEVGWQFGWDNSFNKGYEQYYVGIALSWLGIFLFLAAMLYLPMAHARQSISGDWRRFYDFKTVLAIVVARPGAVALLAALYSLASLPLAILKALPYAFPAWNAEIETMSAVDLLDLVNRYYFWVSVVGFAIYALLKRCSASIYADALLSALSRGSVPENALSAFERETLARLDWGRSATPGPPGIALKLMRYTARPLWVGSMMTLSVLLWFSFVAQIYVSEFIKHHPRHGFLNQPLVQLPWFRYVPRHLELAAEEERKGIDPEEELSPLFRR